MGSRFWVRRFLTVPIGAFTVIALAQVLRASALSRALSEGAAWGLLAAVVFTTSRYFQSRRGHHCAICQDTLEMRPTDSSSVQRGPTCSH
jgi:hypothetical protein